MEEECTLDCTGLVTLSFMTALNMTILLYNMEEQCTLDCTEVVVLSLVTALYTTILL